MAKLEQEIKYALMEPEALRRRIADAESRIAFAATHLADERIRDIEGTLTTYGLSLYLTPATPEQARFVLKYFGGAWDKAFNDYSGKFTFTRRGSLDGMQIFVNVGASKACNVKQVTEQQTQSYTRYVLDGECEPLLADAE